jgi:7-cyano-7-deazaguanine synthase in queuosine biosynthesis
MAIELGDRLVRVRLGSKEIGGPKLERRAQPFTSVPYKVSASGTDFPESTARSRGFKFALLSGLAAYLAGASRVIVPESGQGALGPTLVPVGQAYADYRSHPLFTARMEQFLAALLGVALRYEFPQLWRTKGETLAQYVSECEDGASRWASTWSCWQQNRHVSVEHHKRQCGICAACMLRRLSVHAAGLQEPNTAYVWEDLGASSFEAGAAAAFDRKKITGAMREYAIAGTLHLDHLATMRRSPANALPLSLAAFQLSRVCGLLETETRSRLDRLLSRHESEWKTFLGSLGPDAFIADWSGALA